MIDDMPTIELRAKVPEKRFVAMAMEHEDRIKEVVDKEIKRARDEVNWEEEAQKTSAKIIKQKIEDVVEAAVRRAGQDFFRELDSRVYAAAMDSLERDGTRHVKKMVDLKRAQRRADGE